MTTNTDQETIQEIDLGALRQAWASERTRLRLSYEAMRKNNPSLPTWGGPAPRLTGSCKDNYRSMTPGGRSMAARARWLADNPKQATGEGA